MRGCVVIMALLLASCNILPQQSYVTDVDPRTWRDSAVVELPNTDTLTPRTLHLVIRSNDRLDHDTLTLRIATLSPDTLRFEEPFKITIPRPPKAAAMRREATITYRRQVILSDTGHYRFILTPTRTVRGIEAIGIYIENNRHGKR